MIFHMTQQGAWRLAAAAGHYAADTLTTQGFIHCSDLHQVVGVADTFYHGQPDLVLLVIDPTRLRAEVRYEPGDPPSSSERFPHCYGPLNADAVVDVVPFPPEPDGSFRLPEPLRSMR